MSIMIRFEDPRTNRVSQEFGPYDFVQITHGDLRLAPDGDEVLAFMKDNEWHLTEGLPCSDVIIFAKEED